MIGAKPRTKKQQIKPPKKLQLGTITRKTQTLFSDKIANLDKIERERERFTSRARALARSAACGSNNREMPT